MAAPSGATSWGTPYPTGTDLVRDGDDAMLALANSHDAKIYDCPRGRLFLAANSGSLTSAAWAVWGSGLTTQFAKGGMTVSGTAGLIVPIAGLYRVCAQIYWNAAAASGQGTRRGVRATINGSTATSLVEAMYSAVTASQAATTVTATDVVMLAAGDVVGLGFYQDQTTGMIALGHATGAYTFVSALWMAGT